MTRRHSNVWRLDLLVVTSSVTLTKLPRDARVEQRWPFAGVPYWYITSHKGQLSLLPSAGWKMSTGQGTVQCPAVPCGWEGNRRLCVASAMRQTLLYIHLRAQWPNEGRWDAAIRNMEPFTITAWVYRWAWHIGDGHGGSKQHDGGARWQLPPALHASRLLDVFRQLLVHLFSADVDRLSAVRRRRGQKQLYDAERHRQVPRVSQELRADVGREERRSDRRWTVHLRSAADPQRDGRTRSYRRRRRRP